MSTPGRRGCALATSVAAICAGLFASAASAKTTSSKSSSKPMLAATTTSDCTSVATRQVFSRWGDSALYAAALGGNMEPANQSSWLLFPGATFVTENEPFFLSSSKDGYSLRIPAGSFANAPWLCVGQDFPSARFVVRNTGASSGRLSVDVQYAAADFSVAGNVHVTDIAATSTWAPSAVVSLNLPAGAAYYRVNFTALGSGAVFQMDDLFIDPMRRSL